MKVFDGTFHKDSQVTNCNKICRFSLTTFIRGAK